MAAQTSGGEIATVIGPDPVAVQDTRLLSSEGAGIRYEAVHTEPLVADCELSVSVHVAFVTEYVVGSRELGSEYLL